MTRLDNSMKQIREQSSETGEIRRLLSDVLRIELSVCCTATT